MTETAAPVAIEAHLRRHVDACRTLGSPIYSALMARALLDFRAGGPVADALNGFVGEPARTVPVLRLFGTVHRFALLGEAPELGRYYPSVAGPDVLPFDPAGAWSAFRAVLVDRAAEVRAGIASPPQTNEIGRGVVLAGGLQLLAARHGLPIHLVEIGASGGLNLRPDRLRVELSDGRAFGPVDSPVVVPVDWRGEVPDLTTAVRVLSRTGADRDPVDVSTAAGRLRLTSYVWPDQLDRLARLRAAFELAAALPVPVREQRAGETLQQLQLHPGAVTVVWHSLLWQYLDDDERADVAAGLDTLGATATPDAPLARLSLEPRGRRSPDGVQFVVRLQTWPGDGVEVLGHAHPHRPDVTWQGQTGISAQ
ncbi:MAG TPA: DUF2332 domain-containing protein [Sporichthyaceae bacterium]